ncbi:YicC/YloC family endoribonuclease [Tindallia californiensis]|uniref:TIGR00255 family protein n=1 Tax=Tindallia californiensis TaxID=159292 RepID=A0A1H3NVD1_9FIRM|nr:YicC/YloC family endoribonuclease [Tindallia californiensis]SDY92794.1 TIGR00255 family protein [Tindallia californiensis]
MINSMTGYGRSEVFLNTNAYTIEMKSVNHRYLDIAVKMPRKINFMEEKIKQCVKQYIARGRVDVYINHAGQGEVSKAVTLDKELGRSYRDAFEVLSQELGLKNDLTISHLSRLPEMIILEEPEIDEEKIWKEMEKGIQEAANKLSVMRATEGKSMEEDLKQRIESLKGYIEEIELLSPDYSKAYRERLMKRIQELTDKEFIVDEQRIAMEVAILSEKTCIDEELVRFRSHLKQMDKTLSQTETVGRKLDFMLQEVNREINTIGSKASDFSINSLVVEVKSELEKMREQVQNIE